jgi:hypothetical protein
MSDDFLDEMLGKDSADAPIEASYRMCVGERSVNPIEHEAKERASMEVAALGVELPMIFLDHDTGGLEDGEDWAKYFDGRTPLPYECAELRMELDALVDAHPRVIAARRRVQIARSLGAIRKVQVTRDGRATCPEYEAACKKEGIEP